MSMLYDEVRLTRDSMRYGFAVGKVRVLETRALDRQVFDRLIDARTFDDQLRLLSETSYGRYLDTARTAEDVEAGLALALEDFYGFLSEAELPAPVTRFFRIRHDFANFKAAAKAYVLGVSAEGLFVNHGSVPLATFQGDLAAAPEPFGALAARLMPAAVVEAEHDIATGDLDRSAAAVMIDVAVDCAMFAQLLKTAAESKSRYLIDLAKLSVDLTNVRILLRSSRVGASRDVVAPRLIDGGTVPTRQLAELASLTPEEIADELQRFPALRTLAREALGDPSTLDISLDAVMEVVLKRGSLGQVGPEPVIKYVFDREAEVSALRTVLLGKLAGLGTETLRRRVRAVG